MIFAVKKLPGNTVQIDATLSWSEVKATYKKIFDLLITQVEVPGFRKGKAPADLANKQIDKTRVYEEVLKELVPKAYADAIKQNSIVPIISPKVEVLEASENKDWKFSMATCEKPQISLGNYQKAVSDLKNSKQSKVWVPGQNEEDKKKSEVTLGEVLDAISQEIKVELSDLLIDQEVNRMLSNLINETQKLGMTVEQYLQAQGKTSDSIRQEYTTQAKKTLALEFALEEIAEVEKVTVEDAEIEAVVKNAKTEAERESLVKQKYYISSLLRRQKTLAKLMESPKFAVDTLK